MTATQASTSEFDLFGPWIDEIVSPDQVPPLYRGHRLDLDAAELVLKFPRNIARRDATPDMDLYDHLVVVNASTLTVLSRRTGGPHRAGFDTVEAQLDEVVAVRDSVSLLDGHLTVLTRFGTTVAISYNGSSRENVRRLVDLLRAKVAHAEPSATGAALLRAGRESCDPVAALDLPRADLSLVSNVRDAVRHVPCLALWVGHGRVEVRRRASGLARLVHAVGQSISPATLHGAVLAGDDLTLEVFGRHRWIVRGRAPVMSASRLVVPLSALRTVEVAPDPRHADVVVATLGLGAASVQLVVPEGSQAHQLLQRVSGGGAR